MQARNYVLNLTDKATTPFMAQFLNSKGIRVIRFENKLIWDNLQGVLDIIKAELENKDIENKEY